MFAIMVQNLGQFEKILNYDHDVYTVFLKENLHNKQITYEANNIRTKLTITYTSPTLFNSHFRKANGVSLCQQ